MAVMELNQDKFEETIKAKRAVLVDFYADWCGPCKILSPVIAAVAVDRPELTVAKVNVDNNKELSAKLKISSIPTVHLYVDGALVGSFVGFQPKERVLQFIDPHI